MFTTKIWQRLKVISKLIKIPHNVKMNNSIDSLVYVSSFFSMGNSFEYNLGHTHFSLVSLPLHLTYYELFPNQKWDFIGCILFYYAATS